MRYSCAILLEGVVLYLLFTLYYALMLYPFFTIEIRVQLYERAQVKMEDLAATAGPESASNPLTRISDFPFFFPLWSRE